MSDCTLRRTTPLREKAVKASMNSNPQVRSPKARWMSKLRLQALPEILIFQAKYVFSVRRIVINVAAV